MTDPVRQQRFAETLDKHRKIIYKVCNLYCSKHDDREDLFQDVVYQLWKAFPGFKEEAKISTWMYRIALNTALNYLRKKEKHTAKHIPLFEGAARYYPHQSIDDDRLKMLETCISRLRSLDKAIMILYLDQAGHEEIGNIVGISKSNVGTRISRIKEQLKVMMTEEMGGNGNG